MHKYNMAIKSCNKKSMWPVALMLLQAMEHGKIRPEPQHFELQEFGLLILGARCWYNICMSYQSMFLLIVFLNTVTCLTVFFGSIMVCL